MTEKKGPMMEERLRHYFIGLDYLVLRGVKFRYNQFDVTDIDLWLYARPSPLSRERTNVDIKSKKTPQALERIFWCKGVKEVLGLERCVVVTTDSRPDTTEFGLQHGVTVLDGEFLARLQKSERSHKERLDEEDLLNKIDEIGLGKLGGNWRGRYESAKSRVLSSLDFDGCNAWLEDCRYFLELAIASNQTEGVLWRLVYVTAALFLVGVDFILCDFVGMDAERRRLVLAEGFRYGRSGREFAESIARVAETLVNNASTTPGLGQNIRAELQRQSAELRTELLADHLGKTNVQGSLFELAKELERAAFTVMEPRPSALSTNVQSILGLLSDFYGLDRKRVLI